jgi:glycolate oxidase iron-sulfur subunit
MMQLVDNVQRFGHQQQVRHYISILAESYRKEKKVSNG